MNWPIAITQDLKDGKVEKTFSYKGYQNIEEAKKWIDDIKKEKRILFGYVQDNNGDIKYYETVFDQLRNKDDIDMKQEKYYAKAIIQDTGDDDIFRWISYDEYESLESAKKRISAIENDFRTLFSYVETLDKNGKKSVTYYKAHIDSLGKVDYWDKKETENKTRKL